MISLFCFIWYAQQRYNRYITKVFKVVLLFIVLMDRIVVACYEKFYVGYYLIRVIIYLLYARNKHFNDHYIPFYSSDYYNMAQMCRKGQR